MRLMVINHSVSRQVARSKLFPTTTLLFVMLWKHSASLGHTSFVGTSPENTFHDCREVFALHIVIRLLLAAAEALILPRNFKTLRSSLRIDP